MHKPKKIAASIWSHWIRAECKHTSHINKRRSLYMSSPCMIYMLQDCAGKATRHMTNVCEDSSTRLRKSHVSLSFGKPFMLLKEKLCVTGQHGGSCKQSPHWPVPADKLKVIGRLSGSFGGASHLSCTMPFPPALPNDVLPFAGRLIVYGHGDASSCMPNILKGGDTAKRWLPRSLHASAVHQMHVAPV